MDQRGKKIEVNASSLVHLKAELLRKQEELRQRKLQSRPAEISKPSTNKTSIWSKKKVSVLEAKQEELEKTAEEVDAFEQSKTALASKAKLYEKLTKGDSIPEEDGSQLYLVDFQQKVITKISEERRTRSGTEKSSREDEKNGGKTEADDEDLTAAKPGEEWVDYVDSLGRSRRCLKKDLAGLMEMDRKLTGGKRSSREPQSSSESDGKHELLSADMERELERQKWEKQTEAELDGGGPVGPVHYANVQHSEVRDHGVGFFAFAKDEETRKQQMEDLKELREQTQSQREKHERLKQKRKSALQARLEKVKQRRIVKDNLDHIDFDPMALEDDSENADGLKKEDVEPEPLVRDDAWRKTADVREWDKHKKPAVYDEESWLNKQREERVVEFAPPVQYEQKWKVPLQNNKRSKFRTPSSEKTPSMLSSERLFTEKKSSPAGNVRDTSCSEVLPDTGVDVKNVEYQSRNMEADVSEIPLPVTKDRGMGDVGNTCVPLPRDQVTAPVPWFPGCYTGHGAPPLNTGSYHWPQVLPCNAVYTDAAPEQRIPSENSILTESLGQWDAPQQVSVAAPTVLSQEVEVGSGQSLGTEKPELAEKVAGYVAPQPAHFASAPMKPQPKGPKYTAVNVHEIPLTLPEPPSASFVPSYPSQEEIIGSRKGGKSEQAAIKDWLRQFDQRRSAQGNLTKAMSASAPAETVRKAGSSSTATLLRPPTIPFASPYIQKHEIDSDVDPSVAIFDPAKPPPLLDSNPK